MVARNGSITESAKFVVFLKTTERRHLLPGSERKTSKQQPHSNVVEVENPSGVAQNHRIA